MSSMSRFVALSACGTDFTGKLVDVYPDGRAMILTEGILRMLPHVIDGAGTPGTWCGLQLRLDLWATANVFVPGHRIRLEVSSSNFPRFGRNSITGREIASD